MAGRPRYVENGVASHIQLTFQKALPIVVDDADTGMQKQSVDLFAITQNCRFSLSVVVSPLGFDGLW